MSWRRGNDFGDFLVNVLTLAIICFIIYSGYRLLSFGFNLLKAAIYG